jgi:hypothetical protein
MLKYCDQYFLLVGRTVVRLSQSVRLRGAHLWGGGTRRLVILHVLCCYFALSALSVQNYAQVEPPICLLIGPTDSS